MFSGRKDYVLSDSEMKWFLICSRGGQTSRANLGIPLTNFKKEITPVLRV